MLELHYVFDTGTRSLKGLTEKSNPGFADAASPMQEPGTMAS